MTRYCVIEEIIYKVWVEDRKQWESGKFQKPKWIDEMDILREMNMIW